LAILGQSQFGMIFYVCQIRKPLIDTQSKHHNYQYIIKLQRHRRELFGVVNLTIMSGMAQSLHEK
jgi:hypothetical protein